MNTVKQKPWRARSTRPRKPPIDVAVRGIEPLAQITIYPNVTLLSRRAGRLFRQYPINPDALAQTFSRVPVASGLLPPNTLATGRIDAQPYYVLYIPARVTDLKTPTRTYTIPLPPLVWAGWRNEYRIWALAEPDYPTRDDLLLWSAPFPNCYSDGKICWGKDASLTQAKPDTMLSMLKLFLEDTYFNSHVANGKSKRKPNSVLALYEELDPAQPYPLGDLMPCGPKHAQLSWLLAGGPWRRA